MPRHARLLALIVATVLLAAGCVNPRSQKVLARVAAEASKDCPKMLNEEVELRSVEGLEGVLVYHYRLANQSADMIDGAAYAERMRPNIVQQSCGSANMRSHFLDVGVTVRYDYVDKDQRPVASIEVTGADCKG